MNVWCAVYERAVKHYVKKSHNSKGIEVSFAKSEARREFLKSLEGSPTITGGVRFNETKVNMLKFLFGHPLIHCEFTLKGACRFSLTVFLLNREESRAKTFGF